MEKEGYEKLKTVGKGSFGTAILYRRLEDNGLVVMKEVYLSDMTQLEKSLALNEVQVLASLNHPNIIRYLGNFEKDGSLVIIMEYANGGNLTQLINIKKQRQEVFSEPVILDIFLQICTGISYMHSNKILHRDLKSANIFLNKNGTIKIGDFGISKMMDTRSQAQTVVGTPYYLSPEMCEGKEYNEKSDIWAMGCILYELTCLRKPFEASNLPLLVQKITCCDFPSIPDTYSDGLFHLIEMILQRDYDKRPTALYIKNTIIPAIFQNHDHNTRKVSIRSFSDKSISKERSILYQLTGFTSEPNLYPVDLPHSRIISFSVSVTHCIAVTSAKSVYTWGEDTYGQLAYGHQGFYRKHPIYVDYLKGKNITKCIAGDGFSIFLNENGSVLSCGHGKFGCLGHGDWKTVLQPKQIDSLVNTKIVSISCGTKHVLALALNGRIYSWGSADRGQLGLGHSQQCCKPMVIRISNEYNIQKIYAGPNSSALLTTAGKVLVSGYNNYDKLGSKNVSNILTFDVLALDVKIKEISMSETHTVLLTENGNVLAMGNNDDGQLGKGKNIKGTVIRQIEGLSKVEMISAADSYTIIATNDNVIYFWGSYLKYSGEPNSTGNSGTSLMPLLPNLPMQEIESRFYRLKYSETPTPDKSTSVTEPTPTSIIALYASPENVKDGNILWISEIQANLNCITILVHTTVPPPVKEAETGHDQRSQILGENWFSSKYISKDTELPNTPQIT